MSAEVISGDTNLHLYSKFELSLAIRRRLFILISPFFLRNVPHCCVSRKKLRGPLTNVLESLSTKQLSYLTKMRENFRVLKIGHIKQPFI